MSAPSPVQLLILLIGISMTAIGVIGIVCTADIRAVLGVLALAGISALSFTFGMYYGDRVS